MKCTFWAPGTIEDYGQWSPVKIKDFSLLWVCESRVLEYWIDTCTENIVFSLVGIGLATLLIDVLLSTYYIVILAWGLYYLYVSLRGVLLWETCGNAWNTDRSVGLLVDLNVVVNHFSLLVSHHRNYRRVEKCTADRVSIKMFKKRKLYNFSDFWFV